MAKVPQAPLNALLRTFIRSLEAPEDQGPVVSYVRVRFSSKEFNIWKESEPLRKAAKAAIIADLQYVKFKNEYSILKSWLPKVKARAHKLLTERDQLFEEYEFLRRLMASENEAIRLVKSK